MPEGVLWAVRMVGGRLLAVFAAREHAEECCRSSRWRGLPGERVVEPLDSGELGWTVCGGRVEPPHGASDEVVVCERVPGDRIFLAWIKDLAMADVFAAAYARMTGRAVGVVQGSVFSDPPWGWD